MISALFGIVGIGTCLFLPNAVEKAEGGKVALLVLVAVVCFGIAIVGTAKHGGTGDCRPEWDGFSNSEVCG